MTHLARKLWTRKDERETYAVSGNVNGLKNHDEEDDLMGKVKVWYEDDVVVHEGVVDLLSGSFGGCVSGVCEKERPCEKSKK